MIQDLLSTGWFEASLFFLMFLTIMAGLLAGLWGTCLMLKALYDTIAGLFSPPRRPGLNRRIPLYSVSEDTGEICVRHPLSRDELAERRR